MKEQEQQQQRWMQKQKMSIRNKMIRITITILGVLLIQTIGIYASSSSDSSGSFAGVAVTSMPSSSTASTTTATLTLSTSTSTSPGTIVSTADSRLPMSLTTVITDLEAEGCNDIYTACFLVSKSVTKAQRNTLLQTLFGTNTKSIIIPEDAVDDDEDEEEETTTTPTDHHLEDGTPDTWRSIALSSGLVLAQPVSTSEIASCAVVCDGCIIYYPHPIDLIRKEGLFDSLAPAIESILASKKSQASSQSSQSSLLGTRLYVIGNIDQVRTQFEEAAVIYLSRLINKPLSKSIMTLQDVFDMIVYIPPEIALGQIINDAINNDRMVSPDRITSLVASHVASTSTSAAVMVSGGAMNINTGIGATDLSANNLAAARILGPPARIQLQNAITIIRQSCYDINKELLFVPNFGDLCTATIQTALKNFEITTSQLIQSSLVGKQIKYNFFNELDSVLSDLLEEQLTLLSDTTFDEFKKRLSKLLISPNLETDMYAVVTSSIQSFVLQGKKLITTKYMSNANIIFNSYKILLQRKLKDYVSSRLLNARAAGQFKPLPRKGITVGFHWLLPKPFGNDYRQEPWMIHATDNLVYIPPNKKLSDVATSDIPTGDWRSKIIPSPAGNDMLYMQ